MSDEVEPRYVGSTPAADVAADAYDRLAGLAASAEPRFGRTFGTRLYPLDDGWLSLTELDDDFHQMRVALRIDADGVVTEAVGRMLRHPFDACPRAMASLAGLVGLTIGAPGAQRASRAAIPRTEGCLHVADMVGVAFRAFGIARGHDMPWPATDERRRTILTLLPSTRDTCVSFAVRPEDP